MAWNTSFGRGAFSLPLLSLALPHQWPKSSLNTSSFPVAEHEPYRGASAFLSSRGENLLSAGGLQCSRMYMRLRLRLGNEVAT